MGWGISSRRFGLGLDQRSLGRRQQVRSGWQVGTIVW